MTIYLDFQADLAEVQRYLGYQPGRTVDSPAIDSLLLEVRKAVSQVAKPRGRYRNFSLAREGNAGLYLSAVGLRLVSHDLVSLWQHSGQVSLLTVTLGPEVDSYISFLLAQGQYAKAAIADAVGSVATEIAVEQLNAVIAQEAAVSGMVLTRRFSPGYGDVPLSIQEQLCQALAASELGIAVTSTFLLVPRKSITAMIGWQPPAAATCRPESGCQQCGLKNCSFKRYEGR